MKVKKFFPRFIRRDRPYTPPYPCLWQRHPLQQPYHFKSHGYGPV